MGLTRLSVNRPLTILMALLGIVLMGGVSYTKLKVDRLPPISFGFVSISVSYPQASAEDVEQLILVPLEDAVSGMEGIDTITSTASEGSGQVSLQLVDGADANAAALEVSRRVAARRNRLPTDAGDPVVNKADPNAQPIMNIALTGAPLDQLYDIASNQMQPTLQSVLGVGTVSISGGLQREIQAKVDYAKLAGYGLSIQQVSTALANANVTSPAGSVPQGPQQLDIRAVGRFQNVNDVADTVISQSTTGGPIRLRDIATITEGYKPRTTSQRLNGQDAVGMSIVKVSDANAVQVADDIRAAVEKLKPLLPQGTVVHVTNDTSIFTRSSLEVIQKDLVLAVFLVAAIVLLFLHEWRHTLIVLLSIPTSLISTFLVMYALGFTLNIMSLMALALMIGILVDSSIVVLENIHRHLLMGETPRDAALKGRGEIGMAAIAIALADVVVYTPIAFMNGTIGQLFRQYGLTIVAATLFSLLVSFTLSPMLASRWLTHDGESNSLMARFGRWWDERFDRLGQLVAWTIPFTVRARWLVIASTFVVVALVTSMVPLGMIGMEYTPQEDNGNFNANLTAPPGTSLDEMDKLAHQMEDIITAEPEVENVFTSVSLPGGGGGFGGGGTARASFAVQLAPKDERKRTVFEVLQDLRGKARQVPNSSFNGNVQSALIGGGGFGSVNLQLTGPDLDVLNDVTDQVQAAALTVPGVVQMTNTSTQGTPDLELHLDRARMAQLGITSQQVATALRTTIGGTVSTQLRPPGKTQMDITLIASDADRTRLTNLTSIPVGVVGGTGATGTTGTGGGSAAATPGSVITLGQVATVQSGTGPVRIQRVNRNHSVTLNGVINGRPLAEASNDIRAAVDTVPLPPGYSVQLRGQVNQFNTAISALGQALALALVLEYMLLVALYESWLFPFVRMLTIPLGLIGALVGLYLSGNTINIFSIIGMIMAEGLVAKSGILLVDYANTLRERGMARTEALAEATRVRLRPILMTTCTMVFGMVPLALKLEDGAESRAPMAVVVIGGLLSSTVLTLLVVPALYTLFDDLQNVFSRRRVAAPMAVPAALAAMVPAPALAGAHGSARAVAASSLPSATASGHGTDHGSNGNGHAADHANGHGNGHLAANGHDGQERLVDPRPEPESEGRSGRAS